MTFPCCGREGEELSRSYAVKGRNRRPSYCNTAVELRNAVALLHLPATLFHCKRKNYKLPVARRESAKKKKGGGGGGLEATALLSCTQVRWSRAKVKVRSGQARGLVGSEGESRCCYEGRIWCKRIGTGTWLLHV